MTAQFKTYRILYEHTGEYSYTAKSPTAVYDPDAHDLTETRTALLSSDDWRPVKVDRYEVHDVTLPAWLDVQDWLRIDSYIGWDYTWRFGCDPTWPEVWQRFIFSLASDPAARLATIKLLKVQKFRSDFRRSLREQLETWLNTPEDEREYASPFSRGQWAALTKYDTRDAHQRDAAIYNSGSRHGGCEPWL